MKTRHPRFAQRLQNGGLLLLALGVTVHIVDHQAAAMAGLFVTIALVARLWIELSIRGDEADEKLAKQLQRMGILTHISCLAAGFGLLGFIRDQN